MGLWSISGINTAQETDSDTTNLAECVPVIEPVFTFSNLHLEPNAPTPNGERVRSLAYCCNGYVCTLTKSIFLKYFT